MKDNCFSGAAIVCGTEVTQIDSSVAMFGTVGTIVCGTKVTLNSLHDSSKEICMIKYQDLTFMELGNDDIAVLTPIMKRAFDEDTRIHLGLACGGPPGYDNGDFLRKYALDVHSTAYKILLNDEVIGAVILWIDGGTNQNYLGNIFLILVWKVRESVQKYGVLLKVNILTLRCGKRKLLFSRAETIIFM